MLSVREIILCLEMQACLTGQVQKNSTSKEVAHVRNIMCPDWWISWASATPFLYTGTVDVRTDLSVQKLPPPQVGSPVISLGIVLKDKDAWKWHKDHAEKEQFSVFAS